MQVKRGVAQPSQLFQDGNGIVSHGDALASRRNLFLDAAIILLQTGERKIEFIGEVFSLLVTGSSFVVRVQFQIIETDFVSSSLSSRSSCVGGGGRRRRRNLVNNTQILVAAVDHFETIDGGFAFLEGLLDGIQILECQSEFVTARVEVLVAVDVAAAVVESGGVVAERGKAASRRGRFLFGDGAAAGVKGEGRTTAIQVFLAVLVDRTSNTRFQIGRMCWVHSYYCNSVFGGLSGCPICRASFPFSLHFATNLCRDFSSVSRGRAKPSQGFISVSVIV